MICETDIVNGCGFPLGRGILLLVTHSHDDRGKEGVKYENFPATSLGQRINRERNTFDLFFL